MNIAIIEDDLFAANYLKKVLEEEGLNVIAIIDNAKEAIDFCIQNSVDIVLVDVMLKGNITGAEAAMKIAFEKPEIDLIFLTAYASEEIYHYAMESKAKAYLLKPYREFEIISTIKLIAQNKTNNSKPSSDKIVLIDGYYYDRKSKKLFYNNQEVSLGKRAAMFFDILSKNLFNYHDSSSIVQLIWGSEGTSEALRSLVHRIRKKTSQNIILSNKFGYKFNLKE